MARRRPVSLFTFKKNRPIFYTFTLFHCSAETYGAAPWKLCTQVGEYTRMQACTQIQEDSHVKHHETASHLYSSPFLHRPPLQKHSTFNTISGGHEICAQRPSTAIDYSVCRGSEWLNSTVWFPLPSHRPYMHTVHPISYIQHLRLVRLVWNSVGIPMSWISTVSNDLTSTETITHLCLLPQKMCFIHIRQKNKKWTMRIWWV